MLHVVLRSEDDLDMLPSGTHIGIVRGEGFRVYRREHDEWFDIVTAQTLDRDHLIWGAAILYLPGDQPAAERTDDVVAAAATVIAKAMNVPFVGHKQRRIALALGKAGMLTEHR